ncbi:MAG: hypothetical protein E6J29_06270 [Chloroflexi bacterium]|nr:MAG: hypothetical protein E6J29_06270 [Chloroflexota bacterium]TMD53003.1 MAG: hypothetical protein E6I85_09280 [Chloroflexota bacterium]
MSAAIAAGGLVLAWLGASVLVLSEARRGLAIGLLSAAGGLAAVRAAEGDLVEAGLLLGGGLLAAVAGLRRNRRRGWGLLPPGSTPRIVLCVVAGAGALWLATGLLDSPGEWQARSAAAILIALGAGRLLAAGDPRAMLWAASLVVLGAGALAAMAASETTAALIGAVAAVALNLIPTPPDEEVPAGGG